LTFAWTPLRYPVVGRIHTRADDVFQTLSAALVVFALVVQVAVELGPGSLNETAKAAMAASGAAAVLGVIGPYVWLLGWDIRPGHWRYLLIGTLTFAILGGALAAVAATQGTEHGRSWR
jgi:hypothetical protein